MSPEHAPFVERIRAAFPDLPLEEVEVNTDGLVNIVFRSGSRAFRFARADWAVADLRHELRVLELARQHVSLTLPRYTVIAEDFVTYDWIEGAPLLRNDILRLPEHEQDALAEQLARFLSELHGIPAEALSAAQIRTSGGRQGRAEWLSLYEDIRRELFPLMYRVTRDWVDAHFAPLVHDEGWLDFSPALIHDDLAQYHLLCDPQTRRLCAVIDFGTAGIGDPAADYGILINVYGESLVRRMARFDTRIDGLIDRARFYAGTLELQWVLGGVRSKDFGWFTAHLDRARDVSPYGAALG